MAILDSGSAQLASDPALQRALFFAREMRLGLDLELIHPHAPPSLEAVRSQDREAFADMQATLTAFADQLSAAEGLTVRAHVVWHRHPYQAVVERAVELKPDLVVKATQHDTTLRRTFFNFTDWYLIRLCPAPLLLVKSEDSWASRRIIACINPAHAHSQVELLDNVIIEAAQQMAYRLRGELHIFHTIELWLHPLSAVAAAAMDEAPASVQDVHRDLVAQLLNGYGLTDRRLHMPTGRPERTLLPLVQELDASLVVMGAVSRGALGSLLIGSTAERVLDALPCDVLVVKAAPAEVTVTEPLDCVPC